MKKKAKADDSISLPTSSQQSSEAGDGESSSIYKTLFYSVDTAKFQHQALRLFIIEHLAFWLTSSSEWKALLKIAHPQLLNTNVEVNITSSSKTSVWS